MDRHQQPLETHISGYFKQLFKALRQNRQQGKAVCSYMHRPNTGALMASYSALTCLQRHAETGYCNFLCVISHYAHPSPGHCLLLC